VAAPELPGSRIAGGAGRDSLLMLKEKKIYKK